MGAVKNLIKVLISVLVTAIIIGIVAYFANPALFSSILPSTPTPTSTPAPTRASTPASTQAPTVEILYAWYGIDSNNPAENIVTATTVIAKLKEVVAQYGFIAIPANMNAFYGIDPLPGVPKTTAIALNVNGVRVAGDLRAPEHTDYIYPPSYAGTPAAAAALTAIKASIPGYTSVSTPSIVPAPSAPLPSPVATTSPS